MRMKESFISHYRCGNFLFNFGCIVTYDKKKRIKNAFSKLTMLKFVGDIPCQTLAMLKWKEVSDLKNKEVHQLEWNFAHYWKHVYNMHRLLHRRSTNAFWSMHFHYRVKFHSHGCVSIFGFQICCFLPFQHSELSTWNVMYALHHCGLCENLS